MDYKGYLLKKKNFQNAFLEFIDNEDNTEENFENLLYLLLNDQLIKKDPNEFRLFLHFVDDITKYHYRNKDFFLKIEKIMLQFTDEFNKFLSNNDIFQIFKDNRKVLLFLFKNDIIQIDDEISMKLEDSEIYFEKELKPYIEDDLEVEISPDFDQKREKGENEEIFCQMIRDDLITGFIVYVNRNELLLNTVINESQYETNYFLFGKNPSLIEYSAFYGSIQIFKYLYKNDVELTSSLWTYAIHGRSPEIIEILEEKKIQPEDKSYKECLIHAIKCHHNDIVNYITANILHNELEIDEFIGISSIKYYNYLYFPDDTLFNTHNFYNFCKYDYLYLVEQSLKMKDIDINIKKNDLIQNMSYIFTPLQVAIYFYNNSIVEFLLKQKEINVNIEGLKFNCPIYQETLNALSLSILNDNTKAAKLLLQNEKIELNTIFTKIETFSQGYIGKKIVECSVLHIAIGKNNVEIVEELLSHPNINVNAELIMNNTKNGSKEYNKTSALKYAILFTYSRIVKILLNHPDIDVNKFSIVIYDEQKIEETPLISALIKRNRKLIKYILSHPKIDVNLRFKLKKNERKQKISPLLFALQHNNLRSIKLILSHPKIDINQISIIHEPEYKLKTTALCTAISNYSEDIVSLLLSHENIDVNMQIVQLRDNVKTTYNPLLFSIVTDRINITKLLLNHHNIDVNSKYVYDSANQYIDKNCLILALDRPNEEFLNILLNHPNIDVNAKEYDNLKENSKITEKETAFLHRAIQLKKVNIISNILYNNKIDVNIKSFSRVNKDNIIEETESTAIYYAILHKKIDIIKLLLSKAEIDIKLTQIKTIISNDTFFIEKTTILQSAMNSDNADIVQLLLIYLKKNNITIDNLNEIIKMTNNTKIKSIIYSYMD